MMRGEVLGSGLERAAKSSHRQGGQQGATESFHGCLHWQGKERHRKRKVLRRQHPQHRRGHDLRKDHQQRQDQHVGQQERVHPLMTLCIEMRPTPATTLSTVPTGGVMRPMAPLSTNIRPK